jgi:uncharacterized protein (DUF2267 family)
VEHLLGRLTELTGAGDERAVLRVTHAVMTVLLEQLPPNDRAWLTAALPREVVADISAGQLSYRPSDDLNAFIERVAAREAVTTGFAREHVQAVLRGLGEALEQSARLRLARFLPDELASWLEPKELAAVPSHAAEAHAHHRSTLSEGRPSSRTPLSESAPRRGQQDSLASSDNPHADTKLSSTTGATQEREKETLSQGKSKRS